MVIIYVHCNFEDWLHLQNCITPNASSLLNMNHNMCLQKKFNIQVLQYLCNIYQNVFIYKTSHLLVGMTVIRCPSSMANNPEQENSEEHGPGPSPGGGVGVVAEILSVAEILLVALGKSIKIMSGHLNKLKFCDTLLRTSVSILISMWQLL